MVLIGGYEDSLRRLGVQSWQRDGDSNSMGGRLSAPSYHFDMLQDLDRNRAYRLGIEATVEEGDLVVDIGTGSGLLSILAKRAGAEHCFAIEGDPALQAASKAVIAANGLSEDITVIPKHSTMVTCGFGLDVPYPAHVVVTEIFDSFLLGEGMLPSIIDAKERCLLAPEGGKVVPAGAQMHCLLVESAFLASGESLPDASLFGMTGEVRKSEGPAAIWSGPDPIQIHAGTLLSRGLAYPLAQPFHGLDYDFDRPSTELRRTARVKVETDGTAHGVMIW
jgi:protein arginine N-methyltransferase 7